MMSLDDAKAIADERASELGAYVIRRHAEAPEFWAFYCNDGDEYEPDENPVIVVVKKGTGEVVVPQIPSEEGFELLSQIPEDEC